MNEDVRLPKVTVAQRRHRAIERQQRRQSSLRGPMRLDQPPQRERRGTEACVVLG